ncbi:unnamed protein product [Rangifer tarandus platyrhynchus]|uniref:Uncharacterized protein n=1 Tax=Rangifer tarandus platyrhynchus TaxID=3082113 RepID=A0AC60A6M1_RANTA
MVTTYKDLRACDCSESGRTPTAHCLGITRCCPQPRAPPQPPRPPPQAVPSRLLSSPTTLRSKVKPPGVMEKQPEGVDQNHRARSDTCGPSGPEGSPEAGRERMRLTPCTAPGSRPAQLPLCPPPGQRLFPTPRGESKTSAPLHTHPISPQITSQGHERPLHPSTPTLTSSAVFLRKAYGEQSRL